MLAWSFIVAAVALGQETPRPRVLGVPAFSNDAACPDVPTGVVPEVLRTNAGVLVHQGDGTYTFGCPSRWGDASAKVAVPPDASEVFILAAGVPYRSDNGACSATALPLPAGLTGVDIVFWRNATWLLAAADSQASASGGLFRWDETASDWAVVLAWESDFRPFAFGPGGADTLWVTSVTPRVRIRRLTFLGGLGGDVPLSDMPEDFDGVSEITPVIADEDEAWFVLRRSNQSWTWHAQVVTGDANTVVVFSAPEDRSAFVLGPVKFEETWVSVIDNRVHTSSQLSSAWTDTGASVQWTCLLQAGNRVYACNIDGLDVVDGFSTAGEPRTTPVFAFSQVAAPDPACSDLACDNEFEALSTTIGREVFDETAVCPDGRTASDLDPGGCDCATGTGAGGGFGLGLLGLLGLRRRRQSPPPSHT